MDLVKYIGQIVFVKTINDDILMVKVISKNSNRNKGYKVKILKKNEQNTDFNAVVYNEEINRICILPREVQQGIDLTFGYRPNVNATENLPSVVEFGKRQDDE